VPRWVQDLGWWEVTLVGLVLNLATVGASFVLWSRLVHRRGVRAQTRPVGRRDVVLASTTTLVNALALLPAWWLWREGHLEVADPSLLGTIAGTAYLLVGLETAMYAIHRTFHVGWLYRRFHQVHHTDDEAMTALSLFVMHPLEPLGFALVTGALLVAVPVPFAAIGAFFTVNLVLGTVAHVPLDPTVPASRGDAWMGGSRLHQAHHARPQSAYGFFTTGWDRLLGTR
jgi:lathosterol oxidase